MVPLRLSLLVALACAPALAAPSVVVPAGVPWHARLLKSQPATHDTLTTPPATIKLWFSEPVELGVSRIRLVGPAGTPIPLGKPSHIANAGAAMMAAVTQPLKPGTYRVRWTSAAEDGHAMKGEFSFVIAPGK
ncbi:MAG: copper resistance CopC family protein [Gemmatimonadaceae bacterium]